MVYKISLPLVGSTGTRKKEIIDGDNNLVIDEIRVGSASQTPPAFLGETAAFYSGGSEVTPYQDGERIYKFPFATESISQVGLLSIGQRADAAGSSSPTNGYTSGGRITPPSPTVGVTDVIDKFPFAISDGTATDVGNLLAGTGRSSSGNSSLTHGYAAGGYDPATNSNSNVIQKFSFSVDGNATDAADLTSNRGSHSAVGNTSLTHGYTAGGYGPTDTAREVIDKFPFSSDTNATDVGDLSQGRNVSAGHSSASHGYTSGGYTASFTISNVIDKFPFSSDANATDVGDLTATFFDNSGTSSTTHGYSAGGQVPANTDVIQKFAYAADANATDVGDLVRNNRRTTGTQD